MALPRTSLRSFLATSKSLLKSAYTTPPTAPLTFIIGNESADLDSLCSSILLAYLKTYSPNNNPKRHHYIPLCNLLTPDLNLRTELLPVFRNAKLGVGELITLSDLRVEEIKGKETRWVLVDHNIMSGELGEIFGERVVGILDHHVDEGKPLGGEEKEREERVVEVVGSSASLIFARYRDLFAEPKGKGEEEWDSELAMLGLAPIIIDTINLTDPAKTTDIDREAVKFLEGIINKPGSRNFDTTGYFEEINKAKEDIDSLTLQEVLRKDYKLWIEDGSKLGTAAVVKSFSYLVSKAGSEREFLEIIKTFAEERGLSVMAVMTAINERGFRRELLVWGIDDRGVETGKMFEREVGGKLGLERWEEGKLDWEEAGEGWRRCWHQMRLENSRKQVAPLLRDMMKRAFDLERKIL